jgi:MFS transporter, ACS family, aldohexuronate transporter
LGAIVTPLMVTPIALHFGWRAAFWMTGGLGVAWLVLWWFIARPPLLIPSPRTTKLVWPSLTENRFWMLVVGMGVGGAPLGVISTLSPVYLNRALGMSQRDLGNLLWIPMLGWGIGYYFWGWIADRWVGANQRPVRLYVLLGLLTLPLAAVTRTTSIPAVLALFFWGLFIAVGFITLSLHVAAHAYNRDHTGMVAGIGSGAWGAVLALILLPYGRWFDHKWYEATFVSLSLVPPAGAALWVWISRRAGGGRGPVENG